MKTTENKKKNDPFNAPTIQNILSENKIEIDYRIEIYGREFDYRHRKKKKNEKKYPSWLKPINFAQRSELKTT